MEGAGRVGLDSLALATAPPESTSAAHITPSTVALRTSACTAEQVPVAFDSMLPSLCRCVV